jgi:putative effector of murein hydrolase
VLPNVAISVDSLFAYPYICFADGISAQRSLTVALVIPAVENHGKDSNMVAAMAILNGIIGVLVGRRMLALLKIPDGVFTYSLFLCQVLLCS